MKENTEERQKGEGTGMIKVLIADDQELMRQSLQIILGMENDIEVSGAVENGLEVIRAVRKEKPDVILMDIRMPEMDGVVCTQIIKENYPNIRIIILTTFDDDEYVFNALKYGASGYLLKGISTKELAEAIRKAIDLNTTVLIDCVIDSDDKVFPMVSPGAPIADAFDDTDLKIQ